MAQVLYEVSRGCIEATREGDPCLEDADVYLVGALLARLAEGGLACTGKAVGVVRVRLWGMYALVRVRVRGAIYRSNQ